MVSTHSHPWRHAHGSWSRLRVGSCADMRARRVARGAIPISDICFGPVRPMQWPDVVHLIRITDRNYLELVKAAKRRSVSSVAFGLLSVAVGRLQTESPVAGEFLV